MLQKWMIPLLAACLLLGPVAAPSPADAAAIRWHDYLQGRALAKTEQKPVVVYFHAKWCRYCQQMDKETFAAPKVIDFLSRNFVTIKVDSDQHQDLASRYAVRGLPTIWFLTPAGDKIASHPGFVAPADFLPMLQYLQSGSYLKMSYSDFLHR